MKRILIGILGLFLATLVLGQGKDVISGDLNTLALIKKGYKNKRISSSDGNGNNFDFLKEIKPGDSRIIADIEGAGIINHIWITMAPGPNVLSRNDIIIRMYWDGNEYPSVESPIGPFFGQGWNEQYLFNSLPLTAAPAGGTGLCSYFSMPYSEGARIEIENQTEHDLGAFYYYIDYVEVKKLPEGMGRFHAWYNREITEASSIGELEWGIPGKPQINKNGDGNYVFADIKGEGHFIGLNYYVQNPSPNWYGEGDDMWLIDGEKHPSLVGTGTEDFFNTSWCPKDKFEHPYFGYPRVNNNLGYLGRTHAYRFFIQDPIFFTKSLKGTIEHGHANCLTLDLATVAYWYQAEASPIPNIPAKEERKLKPLIDTQMIHKWRQEWRKSKGDTPKLWGNE